MRKYRARKAGREAKEPQLRINEQEYEQETRQDGEVLAALEASGYIHLLNAEQMTQAEAAEALGFAQGSISKAVAGWKAKQKTRLAAEKYRVEDPCPPFLMENLDEMIEHFARFRSRMFLTPDGKQYLFPEHQRRWLKAILTALLTGGKLMILSPPRHGKTELLAHVHIWLLACVNPNLRVLQVGGNEDIASNTVRMAKENLDDNERLITEYCPPGKSFRPKSKEGKTWTDKKFTVATRTVPGIKSPTMMAVGRGGKLLSRDADLIVLDDIEDDDSTHTEESRQKTRNWFGLTVSTRKEATTAVVVIGSRVNPDDLYGYLLEEGGDDWTVIVEQMHDDACEYNDDDPENHVDCMLWPEYRDFNYMQEKKRDPLVAPIFEMSYQNHPQDKAIAVFPRDLVESTLREDLYAKQIPEKPHIRLIAGLDPSGTGYQASFLWAVRLDTGERYAIDIENRLGGGIARAREVMRRWYEDYGCRVWTVENNLYHGGIVKDEILRDWVQRVGIELIPHQTGKNKWDPGLGVSSLATQMNRGLIHIPWGDTESQLTFAEYRRQLINFSKDTVSKHRSRGTKTDIVMASWFPEETIQRWLRQYQQELEPDVEEDDYPFELMSYDFTRIA